MKTYAYFESEIKKLIRLKEAIPTVEKALAAFSSGQVILPGVINLDLPESKGEVHVKAAYIKGDETYVIKVASGFYENPGLGLAVGNGLMLVFKAKTGELAAVLFDRGYLTDLRTAAAGGVAANCLAKSKIEKVAVIGSGMQARFQLKALGEVRSFREVAAWSRNPFNVRKYIREMAEIFGEVKFYAAETAEEAVKEADLVITATPSRQPIIRAEWLKPGVHITAIGSDGPDKQELYPEVLLRADRVFCDSVTQCCQLGEVHQALKAGVISESKITGEIGELILGLKPGRQSVDEITIADLTGLGVQDAAIANLFLKQAKDSGYQGRALS